MSPDSELRLEVPGSSHVSFRFPAACQPTKDGSCEDRDASLMHLRGLQTFIPLYCCLAFAFFPSLEPILSIATLSSRWSAALYTTCGGRRFWWHLVWPSRRSCCHRHLKTRSRTSAAASP